MEEEEKKKIRTSICEWIGIPDEQRPLEEVKALIEQMTPNVSDQDSGPAQDCYPWRDVFDSMIEHHNSVQTSEDKCPLCGKQLTRIWFDSPKWTWDNLMGRAGTMLICPHCAKQIKFMCFILN